VVVAITFVVGLTSAGIRTAAGVLMVPLEAEFGWNRAEIAGAAAISLIMLGLAAPISGRLADRFGPRLVMLGSVALLAIGVGGTAAMSELWQMSFLWGILVGLGAGGAGSVLHATVATRWFVARRGLVTGILGTAGSTGQLIFIPALMAVVVALGWRAGLLALALVALALIIPIILWMRDDPEDVGLIPQGAAGASDPSLAADQAAPVPLRAAFRTPEFWLLAGSFFVCGGTANGLIGTHLIPHSIDHGIPEVTAAATVGVMGGMNVIGTIASGWLTDKVDPRRLLAIYYSFRGLSLFILPFVADFSGLLIFAIIYGLDWFATVPPTVALTARRFGRRSIGTVYGWIFFSHQLGAATAAIGGGAVRVWLGDYQMAFLAAGVLAMLGAGMALLIRAGQPAPSSLAPAARPA
jgi:sugar phosphate permease